MTKTLLTLVLVALFTTSASADISITDPWARASILAARPGAAYLTIQSSEDDKLIELSSPVAGKIMIHLIETGTDGVNRMVHVKPLELPASQKIVLAPGNMHLMMMGLEEKLKEGTNISITLTFEKADPITIEVPVLGVAASGPEQASK